eukprot:scaffold54230_cov28-Tisochrysis_lutea.AAC.3
MPRDNSGVGPRNGQRQHGRTGTRQHHGRELALDAKKIGNTQRKAEMEATVKRSGVQYHSV